jgi:hypothetical protein
MARPIQLSTKDLLGDPFLDLNLVAAKHRWPFLIEFQVIEMVNSRMFWIQIIFIANLTRMKFVKVI